MDFICYYDFYCNILCILSLHYITYAIAFAIKIAQIKKTPCGVIRVYRVQFGGFGVY